MDRYEIDEEMRKKLERDFPGCFDDIKTSRVTVPKELQKPVVETTSIIRKEVNKPSAVKHANPAPIQSVEMNKLIADILWYCKSKYPTYKGSREEFLNMLNRRFKVNIGMYTLNLWFRDYGIRKTREAKKLKGKPLIAKILNKIGKFLLKIS